MGFGALADAWIGKLNRIMMENPAINFEFCFVSEAILCGTTQVVNCNRRFILAGCEPPM